MHARHFALFRARPIQQRRANHQQDHPPDGPNYTPSWGCGRPTLKIWMSVCITGWVVEPARHVFVRIVLSRLLRWYSGVTCKESLVLKNGFRRVRIFGDGFFFSLETASHHKSVSPGKFFPTRFSPGAALFCYHTTGLLDSGELILFYMCWVPQHKRASYSLLRLIGDAPWLPHITGCWSYSIL